MKVDDIFITAAALSLPDTTSAAADAVAAGDLDPHDVDLCPAHTVRISETSCWEMGLTACAAALNGAGLDAADLDLIAYAGMDLADDQPWSPPHRIARVLGADRAVALGVAQMSNGGAAALQHCVSTLALEPRTHIAIAASASDFTNLPYPRWAAAPTMAYGDGAAAAVLTRDPGPFRVRAIATTGAPPLEATFPAQHPFRIGQKAPSAIDFVGNARLIRAAVATTVEHALEDAGLAPDDPTIAAVIPTRLGRLVHRQCVQPALPAALRDRCVLLGDDTGHLGAGDMLANLAYLHTNIPPAGTTTILITTGAGFTSSCLVVEKSPEITQGHLDAYH